MFSFFTILSALLSFTCCKSESEPDPGGNTGNNNLPFELVTATHLRSNNTSGNSMDGQVVDIDNDGDLDIIIAGEFRPNIILINNGQGVLTDESSSRFPTKTHDSEDIAVADFDNDGDLDIVFVSEDDRINEYYRNTGGAFFEDASSILSVTGTTNSVETTDFNGDGLPDLIMGNAGQNYLLINDGSGAFMDETGSRLPANGATTQDIDLGDVDGDGDLDIVEANETSNRILINDGTGNFTDQSTLRLPVVNDQTREVDLGDIDNDGDLDIFFANVDFGGIGNPQNRLLLNDGSGIFSEATTRLPTSSFRTVDADFVDINGDGSLDILSGNRWNGLDQNVLINDGSGSFSDETIVYLPQMSVYTFDYQVADFNGDGKQDIYLCNFQGRDELLFAK